MAMVTIVENVKRDKEVADLLTNTDLTGGEICKKLKVSTQRVRKIAQSLGIDMNVRGNHIANMKRSKESFYRRQSRADGYKGWMVLDSMSKDGMSLQWLSRKW